MKGGVEALAAELIRAIAIVWHDLGDPDPLARSISAETSRAYLGDILAWAVAEAERARFADRALAVAARDAADERDGMRPEEAEEARTLDVLADYLSGR